jgi:hypothetical protein
VSPRRGSQAAAATDATNSAGQRGTPHALNTAKIGGICRYCDSGNSRRLSDVFPVVQEIVREKIMTRSARIGLAAALLLGGATMAMAQNGPPTGGYPPARWNPNLYRQYGYYPRYYPHYPAVAGYWDYYRTSWPGRGNDEESTR